MLSITKEDLRSRKDDDDLYKDFIYNFVYDIKWKLQSLARERSKHGKKKLKLYVFERFKDSCCSQALRIKRNIRQEVLWCLDNWLIEVSFFEYKQGGKNT